MAVNSTAESCPRSVVTVTGVVPGQASCTSVVSWATGGGGVLVTWGAGVPELAVGPQAATIIATPATGITMAGALRRITGPSCPSRGSIGAAQKANEWLPDCSWRNGRPSVEDVPVAGGRPGGHTPLSLRS